MIPITYMCWGCGSQITVYEDVETSLPVPMVEQWNICFDCLRKKGTDKMVAKAKSEGEG